MKHQMFAFDAGADIRSIVAQLEAASTLLKFAADDLESFAERTNPHIQAVLRQMSAGLQSSAASIFESTLYLDRIDPSIDCSRTSATAAGSPRARRTQA